MLVILTISGKLEVVTGLHIGGSSAFSAIGSVDSPVIKDMETGLPLIPGSSLKGKMRTLLAKQYNHAPALTPDGDEECLTDLFGSSEKEKVKRSRVIFRDMLMDNWNDLREHGFTSRTEIKFENSINRTTAVANPRQIERVVRGSCFPLEIVYELSDVGAIDEEIICRDFEILSMGFQLLQFDYLGGNGSRGYGKVRFKGLELDVPFGDISDDTQTYCQDLLNEV